MRNFALLFICFIFAVGSCGGPLIMRLYFIHGGKRVWFSSWLEVSGFPIILIPLTITYLQRRRQTDQNSFSSPEKTSFFTIKPRLFTASAVIGLLIGLDCYLYAYGVARLPVSTSSLIVAAQLVFTAGFAFLLVRQKFTPYSINAVVLLTAGAGVLAMHTSSDRPENESKGEYMAGFFMSLGASALYGLALPLTELAYKRGRQELTLCLVLEVQMVMCLFATLFCTIGMLINNDFKVIPREAREFELGETKYYVVVVFSAIIWQFNFLGAIGVIFYGSSLLSGVILTVLLPISEILAVIVYKEKFQVEKGVSLALSLWGFISYFYGDMKDEKIHSQNQTQQSSTSEIQTQLKNSETETPQLQAP